MQHDTYPTDIRNIIAYFLEKVKYLESKEERKNQKVIYT